MTAPEASSLKTTPLTGLHRAAGARMVPFAGYDMPVQYASGIIAEHEWTRHAAGLFDVSHMGQAVLIAEDGSHETAASALETLCPIDCLGLEAGRQRYTQLLTDDGGIIDDLMVSRPLGMADGRLMLVINAARKAIDIAHITDRLPAGLRLEPIADRALIALQGPKAAEVLTDLVPEAAGMRFMDALSAEPAALGSTISLSRSGYTGEDGFEISVPAAEAAALWSRFAEDARARPVGLGARDTLRLEAGLCLYGNDIDETTSPVEAGLAWSIGKRRRAAGGFPGAARIRSELADGPARRLVGVTLDGRAPARGGAVIATEDGREIGRVTSGGFGPTVGGAIAMGYVETAHAAAGTPLHAIVRGRPLAATVTALPFVPNRYLR